MQIFVSALQATHQITKDNATASVISFIDPGAEKPYFSNIKPDRHIVFQFSDIVSHQADMNATQKADIIDMINFILSHDMRYPLLIHCMLGASRSTAAAYIALNLIINNKEFEIAQYLRAEIPYAMPNLRMIKIADSLFGAKHRMFQAIASLPMPRTISKNGYAILSTDII